MTGRDDDAGRQFCSFGAEGDIVGTCVVAGMRREEWLGKAIAGCQWSE